MSRKTSIATANARSASCRFITPWARARCWPCRWSAASSFACRASRLAALKLIEAEAITNLYLVPTLYHDLVHHQRFAATDVRSVRKLGFAGAPMTDALLNALQTAF